MKMKLAITFTVQIYSCSLQGI